MKYTKSTNNKKSGSASSNYTTHATYVVTEDDKALHTVLEAATKLYEANPGVIFSSFDTIGTFRSLNLTKAEKLEIVRGICQIHKLSKSCLNKINTLCIKKFGGGINV